MVISSGGNEKEIEKLILLSEIKASFRGKKIAFDQGFEKQARSHSVEMEKREHSGSGKGRYRGPEVGERRAYLGISKWSSVHRLWKMGIGGENMKFRRRR